MSWTPVSTTLILYRHSVLIFYKYSWKGLFLFMLKIIILLLLFRIPCLRKSLRDPGILVFLLSFPYLPIVYKLICMIKMGIDVATSCFSSVCVPAPLLPHLWPQNQWAEESRELLHLFPRPVSLWRSHHLCGFEDLKPVLPKEGSVSVLILAYVYQNLGTS